MPTKNEVNHMAEAYGLIGNDFIVVADTAAIENGDKEPTVKAQAWYRCADCKSFDYSHDTNAIPKSVIEDPVSHQSYLSALCSGNARKSVGVLRYALTE